MSIPFHANIDLNQNELQNARIQNLASDPSSPVEGQVWYNTTSDRYKGYQNSTVVIFATLSDALNAFAVPTADLDINGQKLTNVADPVSDQDAATKGWVTTQVSGARDVKDSVRLATAAAPSSYSRTSNVITFSANGSQSVDGTATVLGDRILLKDGAAGSDNGIYTVTIKGNGGTAEEWTRSSDADSSSEVTAGLYTWSEEGAANADIGWLLTTNNPITLNTTALTFTQVSALGQVTAGDALTKTGNTLDVAVDNSTIEISSDALRVKDAGITDAKLASTFTKKYSVTLTGGSTSEVVTHNLNSRSVIVDISLVGSPYTQVQAEVEKTSVNTVTIKMAASIAAATYLVTIIG